MWASIAASSARPTSHSYRPCKASSRARRRADLEVPRALTPPPWPCGPSRGGTSAFGTAGRCSQLAHQVGHLDGHARSVTALVFDTFPRLRLVVDGEDGVGHRNLVIERDARDPDAALVGDQLEVIGLAADHAADRHQRIEVVAVG